MVSTHEEIGEDRRMWLVVLKDIVVEFSEFETAMRFAEEQTEKSVKVIDARKRVISIVKPGELAVQESA